MANTYKRLDDTRIEINGVIYTDGGSAPSAGSAPVYPSEYIGGVGVSTPAPSPTAPQAPSAAPATNPTNAANPSGYTYTPGSTAPVGGTAMDYATWLQGNTKYQAGVTREKAVKAAEADRQRAVVDAASAFDKSKVTYGANAERAASMGLQNSGYGEYLTGKAYATQRGEVQNANKVAEARKDEALYTEGQMNIAADQKYAADLLGIEEDRNNSYNSLYNSATGGASIESINQDSRWGTLTKEQQTAISQATTANSLMTRLQAGESLDAIKSARGEEWNSLTVDQQAKLQSFYEGKVKAEADAQNSANATNYGNWLSAILGGTATLEQIKTMPGYNQLPDDMKAQLQAAQSKLNEGKARTESYNEFLRNAENGDYTAESITKADGWDKFSETEKDQLLDAVKYYEQQKQAVYTENKNNIRGEMDKALIEGSSTALLNVYSDSYLDDLVKQDVISKDDAKELKGKRDANIRSLIDENINYGDFEAAQNTIDAATDKVIISTDQQSDYYVKMLEKMMPQVQTIPEQNEMRGDIRRLVEQGKLDPDAANELMYQIDLKAGPVPEKKKYF